MSPDNRMVSIEKFAVRFRLKITRDECNDQIIAGYRSHLYCDGNRLCRMVLDGQPANRSKWEGLGGELWMGDISRHPRPASASRT